MSTYLHLECLDHDPPIRSDGEVGQHLYDLDDVRTMIANRHLVVSVLNAELPLSFDSHFDSNAAWFLLKHPRCRLGIRDEYGNQHPVVREEQAMDTDDLEAVHDEGYGRGLADAERIKNGLSPNRYNPYRGTRRGDPNPT